MTALDLAGALAMGLALGAITGMPLGVVNVAIVDAVLAHERRHALGLGLGGALADATHAMLAFVGLGRLVTARPQYSRWLAIVAAAAIIVFAIASWRRRHIARGSASSTRPPAAASDSATATGSDSAFASNSASASASHSTSASASASASPSGRASSTDTRVLRGVLSGIALTLPNPAALAAWVAVAAMTWPDASIAIAASISVGVGVGSAAWFTALGRLVARVKPDHRALRIVPKVALVLFVAIALGGAVRAF